MGCPQTLISTQVTNNLGTRRTYRAGGIWDFSEVDNDVLRQQCGLCQLDTVAECVRLSFNCPLNELVDFTLDFLYELAFDGAVLAIEEFCDSV